MALHANDHKKIADWAVIVVFFTLLCLPLLDSSFSLDRTPTLNENRAPAAFPRFEGPGKTKEFLAGLELYYNDHFGFRKAFVRLHSSWKKKLFGEAAVSEAIIGRDGWLYTSANRMIDNYTGISRFDESRLEAWRQLFETRSAWLKQRNIAYVVVVSPDKHTIYPEHLPVWLKKGSGPSKLDQWVEYLHGHSSVKPLDLRPVLSAEKNAAPVYLMTDTHWNAYGAYVGYRYLVQEIARVLPQVKPLPDTAFRRDPIEGVKGDLAVLLGQESEFPEKNANVMTPLAPLSPLRIEEATRVTGKKHAVITRTFNDQATGKAIVFRDSFGAAWIPLLGHNFREVIFLSQREFDPELIEKEKPDVVIDQIVERIVNTHDPVEMLANDRLPAN